MASEDAESQRAYNKTLAEYDEKSATGAANSDVEEAEEEEDEEQSAISDLVDRTTDRAVQDAIEWGMDFDSIPTKSLSPTLHSPDPDDSDASSHHEADAGDDEEDEEEEEYVEEGAHRELSPTLPAPSAGSAQQSGSTQEGEEGYRPLFPVAQAGETSEVSFTMSDKTANGSWAATPWSTTRTHSSRPSPSTLTRRRTQS